MKCRTRLNVPETSTQIHCEAGLVGGPLTYQFTGGIYGPCTYQLTGGTELFNDRVGVFDKRLRLSQCPEAVFSDVPDEFTVWAKYGQWIDIRLVMPRLHDTDDCTRVI